MTTLAYLECPTGLAGDMCLGALVDAGVPLDYLVEQLQRLGIAREYHLWTEQVYRNGQQATKVHVDLLTTLEETMPREEGVDPYSPFDHSSDPTKPAHTHGDSLDAQQLDDHPHDHAVSRFSHGTASHEHDHGTQQGHEHDRPYHARHLPEIEQLIRVASLPPRAADWSLAVFRRLAEAEGAVHGVAADQVHFHEVGATDAIVDIVGTCLGLDWLGIEALYCSPMPTGGGIIWATHGRLPVPTPAVLKLWQMRQVPVYSNGIERELVTPTGAAIATTLATQFGAPPAMTLHRVGLGAGSRQLPIPNIVRLWIGEGEDDTIRHGRQPVKTGIPVPIGIPAVESNPNRQLVTPGQQQLGQESEQNQSSQEAIVVLETQVDDLNPQAIGYTLDALLAVGALDVFTQAIGMKKSRPGILLTVICYPELVDVCEAVLFRETTTLGIRRSTQQRTILYREIQSVQIEHGTVRVKVAAWAKDGAIANVQPEYEDCVRLAKQNQLPWREIHRLALQRWYLNQ